MRIGVVSPYDLGVPGGVQQQVIELAERLRNRGHDARVVGPGASGPGSADLGGSMGIPANGAVAPIALAPGVWRRVQAVLDGLDVVHLHEPLMPLVGWAALAARPPSVLTFHADPSRLTRTMYRLLGPVVRRAIKTAPVVTAVSPTALGAVGHLRTDFQVVPNALDVASYRLAVERHPKQVVFLGRPDPRKGRDLLVEAWPEVQRAIPESRLVVMGGGDPLDVPGIDFLGRVDERTKRQTLAASSVFCAPNRGGESFGITVAEGMAAGCAVVASDLPAFTDVLAGSGRLFPTGDVRALREALVEVLADPDRLGALQTASSERIEEFDWERIVERYEALYQVAVTA